MPLPLFRLWKATLRQSPAAIAVVDAASGMDWTRAGLDNAAASWAAARAREVGGIPLRGRRVAMAVANGADWFQAFLGLLSLGAVPAPLDPAEPEAAQLEAAQSIGARWIWRAGRLQAVASPRGGGPARPGPRGAGLVKMTSGSSGRPRGLGVTHAQMVADGRQICATMGITAQDANLAVIPLGYSYGLGNLVLPLIALGVRVICLPSAFPQAIAAEARRLRPTVFPAVPPILEALAASDVPRDSFSSVRLVISAGSALSPATSREFAAKFGRRVHGFYGTSETGGIAFDATGEATLEGRSVGPPLLGVRVAFGRGGRFVVSSPAVSGTGRFSPADRGRLNERGEIVLLGRTDRVVKVAGRRVDLAEVESALRAVPGVHDAFAHAPEGEGATLRAAVASALGAAEIRRRLRLRLATWKIPARLIVLGEFPRTVRGKPDARLLRQILEAPRTDASISTLRADRQMSEQR
jgi:acyl-CoA synthetase (AMP-forming)/AMP-acid ligase II